MNGGAPAAKTITAQAAATQAPSAQAAAVQAAAVQAAAVQARNVQTPALQATQAVQAIMHLQLPSAALTCLALTALLTLPLALLPGSTLSGDTVNPLMDLLPTRSSTDPALVLLSMLVGTLAAYVILNFGALPGMLLGRRRRLLLGALLIGSSIWATQFIVLLGLDLPFRIHLDPKLTTLSWLVATLAGGLALSIFTRVRPHREQLMTAGLFMGLGIYSLHYLSMNALIFGGTFSTPLESNATALLIAIGSSCGALATAVRVRHQNGTQRTLTHLLGALTLGVGMTFVHLSAVQGLQFQLDTSASARFSAGVNTLEDPQRQALALTLSVLSVLILIAAAITLLMQARIEQAQAREAELQALVSARTLELEEANTGLLAYATAISLELADPVRRVHDFLELTSQRLHDDPRKAEKFLELARQEAGRVNERVSQLRGLPIEDRRNVPFVSVPLSVMAMQVRSDLEPHLRGRQIRWEQGPMPVVQGDPLLLRLMLTELMLGALEGHTQVPGSRDSANSNSGSHASPARHTVISLQGFTSENEHQVTVHGHSDSGQTRVTPGTASPGTASPGTASPGTASPGTASPSLALPRRLQGRLGPAALKRLTTLHGGQLKLSVLADGSSLAVLTFPHTAAAGVD